jgi:Phage integrase family
LPRIRLHDVRHSYATAALKAGVPGKVISERLGHSTVAFTLQTYTHVLPGMDRDAADQVAGLILGEDRGHKSGHNDVIEGVRKDQGPPAPTDNRRSEGPSLGSGGRI